MNYTKQFINKQNLIHTRYENEVFGCDSSQTHTSSNVSLTTYKTVVDNIQKTHKYYGLNKNNLKEVKEKIKKQRNYLEYTCIHDKISNVYIPLKNIVMSANHNSDRYYAEIQNRINTLIKEANNNHLIPIFMTLTLPSEYHKMKTDKSTKKLISNKKYNHVPPKEAIKQLTRMWSRLRHDRSLKELTKDERIFYRVNEPHKDGTPHTHILLYVPSNTVNRVVNAFKRLFGTKANNIQTNIRNASAYIMKYINKTLPLSKKEHLTEKEKYLNAWYSKHKIIRFNSSRTLAPLKLYRLLYSKFSLEELTKLVKNKKLKIFVPIDNLQKIMEIFNGDELIYRRSDNFKIINQNSV